MRRIAFLALSLCTACGSLSSDEAKQLVSYQERAKLYYDEQNQSQLAQSLEQAMVMADKGLALDPDNYQLGTLRGWVLLRQSKLTNVNGSRQEKLQDQSAEQFDKLYAERIPQRHSHVLLLGYALAQEALGFRHVEESTRLLEAAARSGGETPEVREQRGKANEHIEIGKSKLLQAQQALQALLARGELGLLAHYHLMQVSAALKDHAATFQHGDAYLAEVEKEKKAERARINATSQPKYERYLQSELDRIRKQELDVRELLALLHRNDGENDKQPDADRSRARQAALAHLDVVLQNDPTRSHDYYERALLLQALGRPDAARSDFRKFLATSPLPASSPKKADAVKALGMQ